MNHCMNVFYMLFFIVYYFPFSFVCCWSEYFSSFSYLRHSSNLLRMQSKRNYWRTVASLKGKGGNKSNFSFPSLLIYFHPSLDSSLPHCVSPYRMFPLSQPSVTLSYKISLSFSILHFLSQGFLSRIKSISSVLKRR